MGRVEWGVDPEFFGPRHAHRESRITRRLRRAVPTPGLHLECAAGVGSLSLTLAREGRRVVAIDMSLRSLAHLAHRARTSGLAKDILPVVGDMNNLPFSDDTFSTATSAETLEHLSDDQRAADELARVLQLHGLLVGTVPAEPSQWSFWDDWAGHRRRYKTRDLLSLLRRAGFEAQATTWGWPLVRLYDELFLKRVNRRRLTHEGTIDDDPALRTVSGLGRRRWLVAFVRSLFSLDRVFDGAPWGVGLLFAARKTRSGHSP
jgi:SAM-dependent methyltransferase